MIRRLYKRFGLWKLLLLESDLLCFFVSAVVTSLVYFNGKAFVPHQVPSVSGMVILLLAICGTIISFRYHDLYKRKLVQNSARQLLVLLKNMAVTFLLVVIMRFLVKAEDPLSTSRSQLFNFLFLSYGLLALTRQYLFGVGLRRDRPRRLLRRNILVVGAGEKGSNFAHEIARHGSLGFRIVGFVDDNPDLHDKHVNGYAILGSTGELARIARSQNVEEVFIAIGGIDHSRLMTLVEQCRETGCQVNILSDHFGIIEKKIGQQEFRDLHFVSLHSNISGFYALFLKRWIDVAGALLGIVILSPLFLLIAMLIKLTSRGPVLYVATSVGQGGKAFRFYKFRTMIPNATNAPHKRLVEDFMNGKVVGAKLRHDPRVTPLGRFLRKYSLDEFPQLFNVLKGEMSLIGPRPSTIYEYEMMEDWHKRRYSVQAGMTGLWQVSGRAEVSFVDMIMMDLYYVENCCFWLDCIILLKTIGVVLGARGGH